MPPSGSLFKQRTQVQRVNPDTDRPRSTWIDVLDLCFFFFNKLPEDSTPVPKHVGVDTIKFYGLYFIVYYWVHL
jgi:hypothetical protein